MWTFLMRVEVVCSCSQSILLGARSSITCVDISIKESAIKLVQARFRVLHVAYSWVLCSFHACEY